MQTRVKTADHFWASVVKTESCWYWTGGMDVDGCQGRTHYEGVREAAHRIAWRLTRDPSLAEDVRLIRTCQEARCVNPNHMSLAPTRQEWRKAIDQYLGSAMTQGEAARRMGVSREAFNRHLQKYRANPAT